MPVGISPLRVTTDHYPAQLDDPNHPYPLPSPPLFQSLECFVIFQKCCINTMSTLSLAGETRLPATTYGIPFPSTSIQLIRFLGTKQKWNAHRHLDFIELNNLCWNTLKTVPGIGVEDSLWNRTQVSGLSGFPSPSAVLFSRAHDKAGASQAYVFVYPTGHDSVFLSLRFPALPLHLLLPAWRHQFIILVSSYLLFPVGRPKVASNLAISQAFVHTMDQDVSCLLSSSDPPPPSPLPA